MFDTAEITLRGGSGGDGAISFRREKYVPFGGPDGGDGGGGGSVVVEADPRVNNLLLFRRKGYYRAGRGGNGRGRRKHGARGQDVVLAVPVGTVVWETDGDSRAQLADLTQAGERVVVAGGGKGGQGNVHFASPTNQTPRIAQKGEPGEEKRLLLEMRLIADVGIIGYPNAGKSTLLAAATAAKPKVASYPFTTTQPVVGVVELGLETFVLAEIPGLIEGAHAGRGLGHDFLRHATRTRMFIHVVDGSSEAPVESMVRVNTELGLYDAALARKPQIVALNKVDLPEVRSRLPGILRAFADVGIAAAEVSAATGEGVGALMASAMRMLTEAARSEVERPVKLFRPRPRRESTAVHREGGTFVIRAPGLGRMIVQGDPNSVSVRSQLNHQLVRLGLDRALRNAGAKRGDRVRCGELEWEW